jgi:hypothetical protein
MRDILERLDRALPAVEDWMKALHAQSALRAVAAGALGSARLGQYFPEELLGTSYAVPVEATPFPPVAKLDLPEFEALAQMPMAGITFGHMYFVAPGHWQESLHFHELVHVVQWRTLGVPDFLRTYAVGILRAGYHGSPFEVAAYDLQSRFESRAAISDAMGWIQSHARREHGVTMDLYRSLGMHEGAQPDAAASRPSPA